MGPLTIVFNVAIKKQTVNRLGHGQRRLDSYDKIINKNIEKEIMGRKKSFIAKSGLI